MTQTPGPFLLDRLLLLEEADPDRFRSVAPDRNLAGEVFGGQYLGLSVVAAMRTAPGRAPHAMQGWFLRGAEADRPLEYRVERTRDGRAFAHRRVSVHQDGREVFRADVSFHEHEADQPARQAPMPAAPPAETLTSLRDTILAHADLIGPVAVKRVTNRQSLDLWFAGDPQIGLTRPGEAAETMAWVRPNPLPDPTDTAAWYGTLAYLTDACANFACRVTLADSLYDGSLLSASMNHGVWFHAPPRAYERLLFTIDSPWSGGGLGFNRGLLFAEDGTIVASMVQEALIRRT